MIYKKLAVTVFAMAVSSFSLAADYVAGDDYILTGAKATASGDKVNITEYFGFWCPHCNNFEPLLEKWVGDNAEKVAFDRVPVAFSTRSQNQTLAQMAYFVGKQVKNEKAVDSTLFDFYHKYGRLAGSFSDIEKIKNDPVACNLEVNHLVDRAEKQSASANRPFDVAATTKYLIENVCETDARGWGLMKLAKEARGTIRDQKTLEEILIVAGVSPVNLDKRLSSFSMTSALNTAANKMSEMGIDSVPTLVVNGKYRVTSSKGFGHMLKVVEYLIEKENAENKK